MTIHQHRVTGIHFGQTHKIEGTTVRRLTITTTEGSIELALFPDQEKEENLAVHCWHDDFPKDGNEIEMLVPHKGV